MRAWWCSTHLPCSHLAFTRSVFVRLILDIYRVMRVSFACNVPSSSSGEPSLTSSRSLGCRQVSVEIRADRFGHTSVGFPLELGIATEAEKVLGRGSSDLERHRSGCVERVARWCWRAKTSCSDRGISSTDRLKLGRMWNGVIRRKYPLTCGRNYYYHWWYVFLPTVQARSCTP